MEDISQIYKKIIEKASNAEEAADLLIALNKALNKYESPAVALVNKPDTLPIKPVITPIERKNVTLRHCNTCKVDMPSEEFSYRDSKGRIRYRSSCKACLDNKTSGKTEDQIARENVLKAAGKSRICPICNLDRPISEYFAQRRGTKYNIYPYCSDCAKKYWKAYEQAKRDNMPTKGIVEGLKQTMKVEQKNADESKIKQTVL
jgi:hypothetical protein